MPKKTKHLTEYLFDASPATSKIVKCLKGVLLANITSETFPTLQMNSRVRNSNQENKLCVHFVCDN